MFFFAFLFSVLTVFFIAVTPAFAVWQPLIAAADFAGIQTDVLTAATGILSVFLILLGVYAIIHAIKG